MALLLLTPPPDDKVIALWFSFFTNLVNLAQPLLIAISTAVTVYFARRASTRAEEAKVLTRESVKETQDMITHSAEKSEQRKEEIVSKIGQVQEVGENTNTLMNGRHTVALQTIMAQAEKLAKLTHDPADIDALATARATYEDHKRMQASRVSNTL